MKKNFRTTLRNGIYFPIALLMCCAVTAQATAFQSDTKAGESDKPTASAKTTTETEEPASDQTETDDTKTVSIEEQVEKLTDEYQLEMFDWREKFDAAKSQGEKSRLMRTNPAKAYSKELFSIHEANPDDKAAQNAVRMAVEALGPQTKTKDSTLLLEIARKQDPEEAKKSYLALAKFGSRQIKPEAFGKVFEFAKKETDDATAVDMLKLLTRGSAGYGTLLAAEEIWNRIKANPDDADFDTLKTIALKARPATSGPAYKALFKNYGEHKDLQDVLIRVPRELNSGFEKVIKDVFENGEGDLQTQAAISLAWYAEIRHFAIGVNRLSESQLAILENEKQDLIEYFKSVDKDSELYPAAERELFLLENLSPGDEAPDIVSKDLDGEEFKLSDYRGKVVLLVFWGDWCPPCRAMFPHERSLARALADKPFAIVGVNSDQKPNIKKTICEPKNITWRNFTDFKEEGRISEDWRVRGWPTIYLIDKDGIIREKGPLHISNPGQRGRMLDGAIEDLLAEMDVEVKLTDINHEAADAKAMEAINGPAKKPAAHDHGHSHGHSHDH